MTRTFRRALANRDLRRRLAAVEAENHLLTQENAELHVRVGRAERKARECSGAYIAAYEELAALRAHDVAANAEVAELEEWWRS
jgi:hypothetical protein